MVRWEAITEVAGLVITLYMPALHAWVADVKTRWSLVHACSKNSMFFADNKQQCFGDAEIS
jgi:hypothetical protein